MGRSFCRAGSARVSIALDAPRGRDPAAEANMCRKGATPLWGWNAHSALPFKAKADKNGKAAGFSRSRTPRTRHFGVLFVEGGFRRPPFGSSGRGRMTQGFRGI